LETPFDALVARGLAAGGAALVVVILVLTIVAFRSNPKTPISLRIAIRTGFVALFSAQVVGASMIAKGMVLVFAGHPQTAYATGGTLKPTHAVAMHGILLLPALAWLLSFINWSERRRVTAVSVAAAAYVVLISIVAVGNVAGLSPLQMSPSMKVLWVGGLISLLVTGGVILVGLIRAPTANGIQHS